MGRLQIADQAPEVPKLAEHLLILDRRHPVVSVNRSMRRPNGKDYVVRYGSNRVRDLAIDHVQGSGGRGINDSVIGDRAFSAYHDQYVVTRVSVRSEPVAGGDTD